MITEKLISVAMEICVTALMLQPASHTGPSCPELLALAELESTFNPKAIGTVGEVGLYQIRPEYWGRVPKSIVGQTKKAHSMLSVLKVACASKADLDYIACWNVGITKGQKLLSHNKGGPYRTKFKKLTKKWKKWYEKEETRKVLFAHLYRSYSTKRMVASETLVLSISRTK